MRRAFAQVARRSRTPSRRARRTARAPSPRSRPGAVLWLSATIIIDRPRMSESRMNSWRLSSHFWPTAVRNLMPSNHSSSVSCTSRAKACRCFTALVMISRKRGSLAFFEPRHDGGGEGVFVELAHGLLLRWKGQVYYQKHHATRHVSRLGNSAPRTGALIDGDRKVLDLQAALRSHLPRHSPLLEAMLAHHRGAARTRARRAPPAAQGARRASRCSRATR